MQEGDYGKQRLWGAIGWGTFSAIAGMLIDAAGLEAAFSAHLIMAIPCLFFAMKMRFVLPPHTSDKPRHESAETGQHSSKDEGTAIGTAGRDSSDVCGVSSANRRHSMQHQATAADPHLHANYDDALHSGGADDAETAPLVEQHRHEGDQAPARPLTYFEKLNSLVRRPKVVIFMLQALVMGFGVGVIGEYLFIYLEQLGGSDTLMGISLTVSQLPWCCIVSGSWFCELAEHISKSCVLMRL